MNILYSTKSITAYNLLNKYGIYSETWLLIWLTLSSACWEGKGPKVNE